MHEFEVKIFTDIALAVSDLCDYIEIEKSKRILSERITDLFVKYRTINSDSRVFFEVENMDYNNNLKICYFKYLEAGNLMCVVNNKILNLALNELSKDEIASIIIHEIIHVAYSKTKTIANEIMINGGGYIPTIEELRGMSGLPNLEGGHVVLNLFKSELDFLSDYRMYELEEFDLEGAQQRNDVLYYLFFKMQLHTPHNNGVGKLAAMLGADTYAEEKFWDEVKKIALSKLQDFNKFITMKCDTNKKLIDLLSMEKANTSIILYQNYIDKGINALSGNGLWTNSSAVNTIIRNNSEVPVNESYLLFDKPRVVLSENFIKHIFEKKDNIKSIMMNFDEHIATLTVDIDDIRSKEDKYSLIDEISKYVRLITSKITEYSDLSLAEKNYNQRKKYEEILELLKGYLKTYMDMRETVVKKKIQPKTYGLYVEYPEGYED